MDLYNILGLSKDASSDDIKKAYRQKAMEYHPDRNKEENAEEMFKSITHAYTILSDAEKKEKYDTYGTTDDSDQNVNIHDVFKNMFGGGGGGDPFSSMFGNIFGNGGQQKVQNIINCEISLEEVYNGNSSKKIEFEIVNKCQTCNGIGAVDPSNIIKCITCNGTGNITIKLGPMFFAQQTCNACFGNGTTIRNNKCCSNCKGNKEAKYKQKIKIDIPKGIPNGFQYKLDGKGNYNSESNQYNDLVLIFFYENKPNVNIVEANIMCNIDISLEELLCGFNKTINVYGIELKLISTKYFNPTKPQVFRHKGMPHYKKDKYGDLIVKFNVVYTSDDKIQKYQDVLLKIYKKSAISVTHEGNSPNLLLVE